MRKTISLAAIFLLAATVALAADPDWDAGVAALKAQKYTDAAAAFARYVEKVPDAYQGHMMLGSALLRAGQHSKAVASLQKANELKPEDPSILLSLGQGLVELKRNRDACGVLGKLDVNSVPKANQAALYGLRAKAECSGGSGDLKKLAQTKNDAPSWAAYGSAAVGENNLDEAIAAYDKALGMSPNDEKIRRSQLSALIRKARTAKGTTKDQTYDKAVQSAQKLPSSYDNLLVLGEVQLGAKEYAVAATSFTQASSKNASQWLPLYYLGQAQTALEQYSAALPNLEKALSLTRAADDQKKIYGQLGFVYEKQHRFADSIDNYEKAGDSRGATRVRENQTIAQENKQAEDHNAEVERLEAERKALERKMSDLPPG